MQQNAAGAVLKGRLCIYATFEQMLLWVSDFCKDELATTCEKNG
jgi:hypothetical protein